MHLFDNKLDWAQNFYFEPIEITSEDQFVPLFVAQYSPGGSSIRPIPNSATTKDVLLNLLNHPCPSSYRFSISHAQFMYGVEDYGVDDTVSKLFVGAGGNPRRFSTAVVGLGYIITTIPNVRYGIIKRSPLYQAFNYQYPNSKLMTPEVLILIKAKHVPYMRARMYLRLKITLPLGDMKVLVGTGYRDVYSLRSRFMTSTLMGSFMDQQQPLVEYVPNNVMLSYLTTQPGFIENKTTRQALQDTMELIKDYAN